jgi:hypothetical protein
MAPRPRSSQLEDSTLKLPNNQENYTTKAFLFAQNSPLSHQERIRPPTKRRDLNSDSPVPCPGQQLKAAAQQVLAGLMAEMSTHGDNTTTLSDWKRKWKMEFLGRRAQRREQRRRKGNGWWRRRQRKKEESWKEDDEASS